MQTSTLSDKPDETSPFPWRALGILLAFLAACSLWDLGRVPLIDPDEPVYGEVGKIMARGHSFAAWWTPHYNGAMWFDKPPMTYWLTGLSMTLFGANDFAARLPMALAGLALVLLTARLAWRLFPSSKMAPFMAALAIGTCIQSLILTRACVTDMLFAASLTAALLAAWEWLQNGRWASILCSGLAVGIAILIKGLVAIVLIGAQLLIYLIAAKQLPRFMSAQVWLSLLLALVIAAPWYASMVHLHGHYFVQSFLEAQNVTRYLSAEHKSTASPLFFIPVLLAGFLPWTFALIPALVTSYRRMRTGNQSDLFALIWIVLVFIFFSASQSKLVTYIFPLYPLAACVTGYWVAELATKKGAMAFGIGWILLSAAILGFVLSPNPIATRLIADDRYVNFGVFCMLLFVLPPFTFFLTRLLRRIGGPARRDWPEFFNYPVYLPIFFALVASNAYWSHPDPKAISAVDMAHAVAQNSKPGDTIYALTFNKPSLVYYSERHITYTDDQEMVGPLLSKAPYPLCVTKPDILRQLEQKHLLAPYRTLSQIGTEVVLIQCNPPARGGIQGKMN